MLADIIVYYFAAVVVIWLAQFLVVQFVNVHEKILERKLKASGLPDDSEEFAPNIDWMLRINSSVRLFAKLVVLVVLGYGAWFFGSRHDGWWWGSG